ncbi:DUF1697 domain-containing protein [Anaerolentibacter hominis]|uniref:DUF1697 domain-containing protein n=1 Tax=Anaerolentibacter hominis TaxID=3079009 RepID=UPI0031B82B40
MKRYVALLRGINISGRKKITMAELKENLEDMEFENVVTYLNSGNVLFSCNVADEAEISRKIEEMIRDKFGLEIPVYVKDMEFINDILSHAPSWWGTDSKEIYDNLIFVIPPADAEMIVDKIGEPTENLEKIKIYKNIIFWSFNRKSYSKANWWKKTASAGIGEWLTIRTANTVRKLADLDRKRSQQHK